MQQKNLLLFFILSFFIFAGWNALQNHLWPPAKRKRPDPAAEELKLPDTRLWAAAPALLGPASGVPGLGDACRQATQLALVEWAAGDRDQWVKHPAPPEPVRPEPTPPTPEKIETITLGNPDDFNLEVVLTSRGGGVQRLILNRFDQANRLGLPERPEQKLHLIPDDPMGEPSNLLFHYADPKATNPVDTLGRRPWLVKEKKMDGDDGEHKVVFAADVPGQHLTITKTYSLRKGDYHLGLDIRFERHADRKEPLTFRYQLAGAHGLPIEGEWYTYTYRNSLIGLVDYDPATETSKGNVWRDLQDSRTIAIQQGGKDVLRDPKSYLAYAGVATQYFASMIVVSNKQDEGTKPNFLAWARPTVEGPQNLKKPYLDDITTRVISEPLVLEAGKPVVHRYLLYNGPVKVRLLGDEAVAADLVQRYENTLHLATLTDSRSPQPFAPLEGISLFFSYIGWTNLLILCTNIMHGLLSLLHHLVANYGLCVIALTVLVRGTMFPLSRKQAIAAARMQEKMRELAPDIKKLEEKFAGDPMALQQAKNELYLKRGINPLAMMGSCWMVLLQMPIFMGLYYCLQESIHFRLASFLWIRNLAAPDMLFEWGENIPWISRPEDQGGILYLGPFLNILPIIAVALMLVQQKMMTPPPTNEQEEINQKVMKWMMVVMGLMFYKMPAGLCIYFIASSLWGVSERKFLPKREHGVPTVEAPGGKGAKGGGKGGAPKKPAPKENGDGAFQKIKDWWEEVLKEARKTRK